MRRRTVIRYLLAGAGLLPFSRLRGWAQRAGFPGQRGDTLRELASVVLPSSLGRAKTDEIADRFIQWVHDYRPGADMAHGYGSPRLQAKPPSPAQNYTQQLEMLEGSALAQGASLARLEPGAKRVIVEASLREAKVGALPPGPNGRHVVADLMSFYFHSSEANDLCYRALIGRDECLGLPGSEKAPARLPEKA